MDFEAKDAASTMSAPADPGLSPRGVESRTGQLKLRVVDED
jgi:hypothetical protein